MFNFIFNTFKPARLVGQNKPEAPKAPEANVVMGEDVITPDQRAARTKEAGSQAIRAAGKVHPDLVAAGRVEMRHDNQAIGDALRRTTDSSKATPETDEAAAKRELIREARMLKTKVDQYQDFNSQQVRNAFYKDGNTLMENLYKAGAVKYSELANFGKYSNLDKDNKIPNNAKAANAALAKVIAMGAPIPNVG
jgi:hypothetical protein